MIKLRVLLVVLGVIAAMGVGALERSTQAAEPAPATQPAIERLSPEQGERVSRLMQDLGAVSWRVREEAQEALVQIGLDIRPPLERLTLETVDDEVRSRAEAVLRRIEHLRLSGPSTITLRMTNATPREIFEEIGRQASCKFGLVDPDLWESRSFPRIDVTVDRQPFWSVMLDLCARLNLVPQNNGGELALADASAAGRPFGAGFSVVDGPFLIVATSVVRSTSADLASKATSRKGNIHFTIYGEPKLRVIQAPTQMQMLEVVDQHGKSLLRQRASGTAIKFSSDTCVWNVSASFQPEEESERLAMLKGSATFILQTRGESAEFPDILGDPHQTGQVAGRRATIREVKRVEDGYVVHVSFSRGGSHQERQQYPNSMRLIDADGTVLRRPQQLPENQAGLHDELALALHYRPAEGQTLVEPLKLVWELPLESKEIVVPFEFRDVPIP